MRPERHCLCPLQEAKGQSGFSLAGGVAAEAPQLGLNSAGDEGFLKITMSPGSPGPQDYKYLDLGGRCSELNTELQCLER